MAFKIPLNLQVAASRLGVVFAPFSNAAARVEQSISYKDGFRLPLYKVIEQITLATRKLRWTSDPWDGKLDVIKHPTFMQQAIEQHPDYSGDCDDFAAYWCVALHKSKLADEQWFASGLWVEKGEIAGHAVCVFRCGDKWFYAGNWNDCVPIPITSSLGWVADIEKRNGPGTKIFSAVMYKASGLADDTMHLGRAVVARW